MIKGTSKKRMLLLELLLSVVIFALCVSVCFLVYLRANTLSVESWELTRAVFAAASAAEVFANGSADTVAALGGGAQQDGGRVYYDSDWNAAASGDTWLQMEINPLDGREEADIRVYTGDRLIYQLKCQRLAMGTEE